MGTITKTIGTGVGSAGTGTVTAAGTAAVTGSSTLFLSELRDGSNFPLTISVGGTLYSVATVNSDTSLTLTSNYTPTFTGSAFTKGLRNYATLPDWYAALPANLTTDGNAQVASLYNDSEFVLTSALNLNVPGDSTNHITITTGTGQSFRDNASVRSNSLSYNQANGVAITSADTRTIIASVPNVLLSNLQIRNSAGGSNALYTTVSPELTVNDCIIRADGNAAISVGASAVAILNNCLATLRRLDG